MRLILAVVVALVASASAYVEVFGPRGYHEEVGIPLAKKLKAAEEKSMMSDKIIGGFISPANSHPYLGGLLITFVNSPATSVCGSSLVSNTRLVTAAHCWFDGEKQANQLTVILGTQTLWFGGTRIPTSHVITHPRWNPWNLSNDVAIIYLPFAVSYSATIQPIRLPSGRELSQSFAGQWATAAGYGAVSDRQKSASNVVSQVQLQVITVPQCQALYGPQIVSQSTLCTSGQGFVGVCGGDSGGPLYIQRGGDRLLIGISSFAAKNNCQGGLPSAFTRVTSFMSFISQHMGRQNWP